jgi:hypothetical protein
MRHTYIWNGLELIPWKGVSLIHAFVVTKLHVFSDYVQKKKKKKKTVEKRRTLPYTGEMSPETPSLRIKSGTFGNVSIPSVGEAPYLLTRLSFRR